MLVAVGLYDRGMVGEGFTFRMEVEKIPYGAWVRVSVAGKTMRGVVLGAGDTGLAEESVHNVLAVETHPLNFMLTRAQCELVLWISSFYCSPLQRVLRLMVPAPLWKGSFIPQEQKQVSALVSEEDIPARQRQQRNLLHYVAERDTVPFEGLREEFSAALYKKAVEAGYIKETSLGLLPVVPWKGDMQPSRRLTREQQQIVDTMDTRYPETALLYGVTGAGKTEMYLHRAETMRDRGRQTALLVPEIALTPQLVRYFQRVFGGRVAVLHSHLAEGEKCQEWLRVAHHDVDVIIGSRSAIFAPYAQLGQIILDEEHEWTYKNEQNPRYLTHRVAEKMASIAAELGQDVGVLFASGTPSIERFARARKDVEGSSALHLYTLAEKIFEQHPQ